MRIVCFTCITGGYDSLKQPLVPCPGVDFICFTDSLFMDGGRWQTRRIPAELGGLSKVKQQRIVKACPHRFLPQYDISIWIDGSMTVCRDLKAFISQYDLDACPLYTRVHQIRHCIYDEAEACKAMRKDSSAVIDAQMAAYREEGYPKKAGMIESGVMLRKHNDPKCIALCNLWAAEILKHSHRDQLSFNYVCWKLHFIPGVLANEFKLGMRAEDQTFKLSLHR